MHSFFGEDRTASTRQHARLRKTQHGPQVHYSCPRGLCVYLCRMLPPAVISTHGVGNVRKTCWMRPDGSTLSLTATGAPAPHWVALPCAQNAPWCGTRKCDVPSVLPGLLLFNGVEKTVKLASNELREI